jgi:hypothetical protein
MLWLGLRSAKVEVLLCIIESRGGGWFLIGNKNQKKSPSYYLLAVFVYCLNTPILYIIPINLLTKIRIIDFFMLHCKEDPVARK